MARECFHIFAEICAYSFPLMPQPLCHHSTACTLCMHFLQQSPQNGHATDKKKVDPKEVMYYPLIKTWGPEPAPEPYCVAPWAPMCLRLRFRHTDHNHLKFNLKKVVIFFLWILSARMSHFNFKFSKCLSLLYLSQNSVYCNNGIWVTEILERKQLLPK
jgi:hypothetical protein